MHENRCLVEMPAEKECFEKFFSVGWQVVGLGCELLVLSEREGAFTTQVEVECQSKVVRESWKGMEADRQLNR